jgi:hypothetical protein
MRAGQCQRHQLHTICSFAQNRHSARCARSAEPHSSKANPHSTLALEQNSFFTHTAASYGTVNNLGVLTLSWPSKSFVESDTTASAVEARIEMFPDGGIFANVPSIGDCVVLLSQEEVDAVNALGALAAIRNGIDRTPTNRCEQVLSSMLHILSSRDDSTGDGCVAIGCQSRLLYWVQFQ